MSSVLNIFSDGDSFSSLVEADAVVGELAEDVLEVQYPDSKRGLGRSRSDVNNRLKKFIARCKLCQLKADDADRDGWKAMGRAAVKLSVEMRNTKDALQTLDGIW